MGQSPGSTPGVVLPHSSTLVLFVTVLKVNFSLLCHGYKQHWYSAAIGVSIPIGLDNHKIVSLRQAT